MSQNENLHERAREPMSRRFYVEHPIQGDSVSLSDAEAKHITGVLRLGEGDRVVLFDGSGTEFSAEIIRARKGSVECQIVARRVISRELPTPLRLCVALPKGDRQRWLVEKAVELGVQELIPLKTERGVALPTDSAITRMRRTVIEASKQCGRNQLMEIGEPRGLPEFTVRQGERFLIAHPDDQEMTGVCCDGSCVTVAVGPEGGFSTDELAMGIAAGWKAVSLGPRILRIETAAVAVAAWFSLSQSTG